MRPHAVKYPERQPPLRWKARGRTLFGVEPKERTAWESATRPLVTERIKAATDASAENLSALARAMGTTPKTIYALRDGKHAPDIFTLYLLARETGRDMEWFVSGALCLSRPLPGRPIDARTGQQLTPPRDPSVKHAG